MHDSPLAAWDNFYVIIGSSAAALIGLQFVVIALLAETKWRTSTKEVDAFATPTIIHFAAALLVSSILNAPWPSLSSTSVTLGLCGCAGVGYVGVVIRRQRRTINYKPVLEDWIWHATLPLVAYTLLVAASLALVRHPMVSLFVVGGAALLLLFIGIHNAWDTVTFITLEQLQGRDGNAPSNRPSS